MLTKSSEYALRALIYLTQHVDDWPISGARIAAQTRIPSKYLSKILGDLVRAGVLEGTRGLHGGFRLSRSADRVHLYEVLLPFETFLSRSRTCPFASQRCSDRNPCMGHEGWKQVREGLEGFLKHTSLKQVSMGRKTH